MDRIGRFLVVLILLGSVGQAAAAGPATAIPSQDRAAIRHVIASQIKAFEQDNGSAAFGLSTPQLRARFQNAGNFMRMVRKNYGAVYRPSQVSFGALDVLDDGTKVQHVLVVDGDGKTHEALYVMEREQDGKWLVAGVFLMDSDLVPA
jgi:hypothetical protein